MGRTLSVLLAVLLLSGAFAPAFSTAGVQGPTGEARASHGDLTSCTIELLMWGFYADVGDAGPCDNDVHDETLSDWLGVYSQGAQQAASARSYHDTYENALAGWEDQAWLVAERAMARELANGSSVSTARVAAKDAVDEFYAARQKNFVNQWNNQVATLESMRTQADALPSHNSHDVFNLGTHDTTTVATEPQNATFDGIQESDITLVDNSTTMMRELVIGVHWGTDKVSRQVSITDTRTVYGGNGGTLHVNHVNNPTPAGQNASDFPTVTPLWIDARFNQTWIAIEDQRDEVHSELDLWTTNVDWDSVNVTELLSRVNLMNNYQLDASEDATFNDAIIALAASGYSVTNLTSTGYMNVTYTQSDGSTVVTTDGMVASTVAPPNGTWEIGTEYDSETIDGSQLVARLDGGVDAINGTFTINAAYDADGVELEDTVIESPEREFRATNTTELQNLIIELGERIEELEDRDADEQSGGAGVGWQYTGLPDVLGWLGGAGEVILIVIAGGVALVLTLLVVTNQ